MENATEPRPDGDPGPERAGTPRPSSGGAVLIPATSRRAAAGAAPTPPPPPAVVTCLGVEVTQAIQDMDHSVPLIDGKDTYVRVYLDIRAGAPVPVRGLLAVGEPGGPGDGLGTVTSVDAVVLDPALNGRLGDKRGDLAHSLNFRIPAELTRVGGRVFALESLRRGDNGDALDVPAGASRAVTFGPGAPLRVRVLGIRFRERDDDDAPEFEPNDLDFDLIRSWLGRAYPTPAVIWSRATLDGPKPWPFDADDVNAFLRAVRFQDVANGTDGRTHYYGLVADGGSGGAFFMRGKASAIPESPDPSAVASGPTGVPSGSFAWDTDGSYGDWYAGHELAHTFGRLHAEFCDAPSGAPYPFPNGQLSGPGEEFVGLDVGDAAHSLPPRALPGTRWHDVMTYCDNQWPSSFTYEGILTRLAMEDNLTSGPTRASAGAPAGPSLLAGPVPAPPAGTIHLVARADLGAATGSIRHVQPYPGRPTPPNAAPPGRADDGRPLAIRLLDAGGNVLLQLPAPFYPNVCSGRARPTPPGRRTPSSHASSPSSPQAAALDRESDGSRGLVDAHIPLLDAADSIELVLGDTVLDSFRRGPHPAPIENIRPGAPTPLGPATRAAAASAGPGPGPAAPRRAAARSRPVITWDVSRPEPRRSAVRGTAAALGAAPVARAAADDGPPCRYTVELSADGGATWRTIGLGLEDPRVAIDPRLIRGVDSVLLRVSSTDGFLRTTKETSLATASLR